METKKRKSMAVTNFVITLFLSYTKEMEEIERNYESTCARGHVKRIPDIFMSSA